MAVSDIGQLAGIAADDGCTMRRLGIRMVLDRPSCKATVSVVSAVPRGSSRTIVEGAVAWPGSACSRMPSVSDPGCGSPVVKLAGAWL